ncbi:MULTISPECIES: endo-1,4-beta-xylanase [Rhodococcus]|uniref:GH10 domain-containing protein n=1 Tax=Rhodococcus cerastii TaxID=908616 RepID=A0ABU4D5N1_9NOCA|nr:MULTISPECIES: endo-1,4-beta-xylanase [Rhodococcus]MDV6304411.1 hypothetical protein [Rhodococcus cerastii]MDV7991253.1 hypothetical protein [Rhodococcus sp. IEGM 1374]MDV8077528.1 hypothetical protein [Rhodococcus sp. IEGM 1370]
MKRALVLVLLIAAMFTVTAPANAANGDLQLGFASGSELGRLSPEDLDRQLQSAADVGATWVRVEMDWGDIEPEPGVFTWDSTDRVVASARAHGLQILGLLTYTPVWAQRGFVLPGSQQAAPADPNQFGNFAAAAASRYTDSIQTWEIWNEPNIAVFYGPSVDVRSYLQVLQAGYVRIHEIQPGATVLSGGLSNAQDVLPIGLSPVAFLNQLYALGGGAFLDGVAMHPYTTPGYAPDNANWTQMAAMHTTMQNNGDGGKQIWITEYGAPTGNIGSEQRQSDILTSALASANTVPFIARPMFIHSIRDGGTDPASPEANYGVLRKDFTPKQAFYTLQGMFS